MRGRERFLTALENKKSDHLPCQVHGWMQYYLDTFLDGMDQYKAYDRFGMDPVIYTSPEYIYSDSDLANWQIAQNPFVGKHGNQSIKHTVNTPKGILTFTTGSNEFTTWVTEPIIKDKNDFEIWNEYVPVPISVDWTPVRNAKEKISENGIVRGSYFDFGQGSPWQSFEILFGMEKMIMTAIDEPDWVHHVLEAMLQKKLKAIEAAGTIEFDLVETGGGAGSSTVISPTMHKEFCLPYDIKQHKALHEAGTKVVYHLCGGLMPLLETVAENGADALETMTPPEMGGDCDLAEASKRIGNKLCFIGGFNQNAGFENGIQDVVRQMVRSCFEATKDHGGYIISPSDHFFRGDPGNLLAFAQESKNCMYV